MASEFEVYFPDIVQMYFPNQMGKEVCAWITYFGNEVSSVAYAAAPFWQMETVDFSKKAA